MISPDLEISGEMSALINTMVKRGDFGAKTGRGFYEWSDERAAELRTRIAKGLANIIKWK